jgi:hypothetical protein
MWGPRSDVVSYAMPEHPQSKTQNRLVTALKYCLSDLDPFSRLVLRCPLRPYQLEPARAIVDSVLHHKGLTFAVMMARQAGKNELSAQLQAYLLNLYQRRGGQIVKASPTFKPQTINSILRLVDRLDNAWNRTQYRRREGYMIELGRARCLFFSAEPLAKVVGATADLLLEADEAQDIDPGKMFKDFAPMVASTHATQVLYGTAWTSDTLLATTIAHLRQEEQRDGLRRVFTYDADQVAAYLPAYGEHVRQMVGRLGRDHPLIKTQYYLEAIDSQGGLFPPQRRALIHGSHPRQHEPSPALGTTSDRRYALLLDVAGEDPGARHLPGALHLHNPRRDATALTIVEVEPRPGQLPLYRTVDRHLWLGIAHTALHAQILALTVHWHATWIVVDATGIGAGLASFLAAALPDRVIPITFSARTKSELGWAFVAAVETGRYQDYLDDQQPDTRQFWHEVDRCQYEILPGPGEQMRWGVWDAPAYDGLLAHGHDDLLISAALCTLLDRRATPLVTGEAYVVTAPDPLLDIDRTPW